MERFQASIANPKMERRIIEKNRRNHMKSLYAKLYSLLPNDSSKVSLPLKIYSIQMEVLPLPDQIDEAINHIKSMEKKLEKYKEKKKLLYGNKEKKEKLLYGKRPYSCTKSEISVEVQDMGPNMNVILISGLEEQASFYGIMRQICEEGFEVVNANFSSTGNSMLQVVHEKGGISTSRTEATAVAERLKELICGYSHGDVESRLDLWDFEIEPDILTSDICDLELMPTGQFCFLHQL